MYACVSYYLKERSHEIYYGGENVLTAFRNRLGNLILRPPEDYFLISENDNCAIMPTKVWEERIGKTKKDMTRKCVICNDSCHDCESYLILLCGSLSSDDYFLDHEQNLKLGQKSKLHQLENESAYHKDELIHVGCLRDYIATKACNEYPIPCPMGSGDYHHPILINHPEKLLSEVISLRSKDFKQLVCLRKFIFVVFQNFINRKIKYLWKTHEQILSRQMTTLKEKQKLVSLAFQLEFKPTQGKDLLLCGDLRQFIHPNFLFHTTNFMFDQFYEKNLLDTSRKLLIPHLCDQCGHRKALWWPTLNGMEGCFQCKKPYKMYLYAINDCSIRDKKSDFIFKVFAPRVVHVMSANDRRRCYVFNGWS